MYGDKLDLDAIHTYWLKNGFVEQELRCNDRLHVARRIGNMKCTHSGRAYFKSYTSPELHHPHIFISYSRSTCCKFGNPFSGLVHKIITKLKRHFWEIDKVGEITLLQTLLSQRGLRG